MLSWLKEGITAKSPPTNLARRGDVSETDRKGGELLSWPAHHSSWRWFARKLMAAFMNRGLGDRYRVSLWFAWAFDAAWNLESHRCRGSFTPCLELRIDGSLPVSPRLFAFAFVTIIWPSPHALLQAHAAENG